MTTTSHGSKPLAAWSLLGIVLAILPLPAHAVAARSSTRMVVIMFHPLFLLGVAVSIAIAIRFTKGSSWSKAATALAGILLQTLAISIVVRKFPDMIPLSEGGYLLDRRIAALALLPVCVFGTCLISRAFSNMRRPRLVSAVLIACLLASYYGMARTNIPGTGSSGGTSSMLEAGHKSRMEARDRNNYGPKGTYLGLIAPYGGRTAKMLIPSNIHYAEPFDISWDEAGLDTGTTDGKVPTLYLFEGALRLQIRKPGSSYSFNRQVKTDRIIWAVPCLETADGLPSCGHALTKFGPGTRRTSPYVGHIGCDAISEMIRLTPGIDHARRLRILTIAHCSWPWTGPLPLRGSRQDDSGEYVTTTRALATNTIDERSRNQVLCIADTMRAFLSEARGPYVDVVIPADILYDRASYLYYCRDERTMRPPTSTPRTGNPS